MKPGQIILLGETHGTKEAPLYVEQIVRIALECNLSVTVGLELPRSDEFTIHQYLESNGSIWAKKRILELPFWSQDFQDGRASQAMFELIESLRKFRSKKKKIKLMLIDTPQSEQRDSEMAKRIIQMAEENPMDFIILLTGNLHNRIGGNDMTMGGLISERLNDGRVLSLKQDYMTGSAWIATSLIHSGPVDLVGDGRNEIGIFLDLPDPAYHGTLEMKSVHHSRPAKEYLGQLDKK